MYQKKWLLKIFFLSIGLNGALFGLLFYFTLKESFFFPSLSFSFKPTSVLAPLPETDPRITKYKSYSFDRLVEALQDRTPLLENVVVCDVALALLVQEHHFAIEEALFQSYLEKEERPSMVTFYVGLDESDFRQVYDYAKRERAPFTNKGLFLKLQAQRDPELESAFLRTELFHLVRVLFAESGRSLDDRLLLALLLEGDFELLSSYYEEQKKGMNLSKKRRLQFLSAYLKKRAPTAAYLLLVLEYQSVVTTFDEERLSLMVEMIAKKSRVTIAFLKAMTTPERSAALRELGQRKLAAL